jgi:multidrug efflux pump subunit AcrA (membrane-fusion protein)
MFANVAVALQTAPDALLVPRAALVEQERATYVFVVAPAPAGAGGEGDGDGAAEGPAFVAERVEVEVLGTGGVRQRDVVAVEGELRPGLRVITLGQQELRDGSPVTVAAAGGRPAGAAEARP